MVCEKCGKQINDGLNFEEFQQIGEKYRDIKYMQGKYPETCLDCTNDLYVKLKKSCLVDIFNGIPMYCVDNKYVPYIGCTYYYKTLEEFKLAHGIK